MIQEMMILKTVKRNNEASDCFEGIKIEFSMIEII